MNDLQTLVALELQRVLETGGFRAGALLVTREPLPGPELDTRVLSAIAIRELNIETAVDLVNLIKAMRASAHDLAAHLAGGRARGTPCGGRWVPSACSQVGDAPQASCDGGKR
jgi:hypothetical protein